MTWEEFIAACIPSPDTIVVEAKLPSGSHGPLYATAVGVPLCVVQEGVREVPVSTGGASGQVKVSTAQIWAPLATTAPAGSRITLPSGRVTYALTVETLTASGHDLPEHLEIAVE